ncbi:hypothetical protein ADUPG1_001996, partial [Aduncisulcus paluster]
MTRLITPKRRSKRKTPYPITTYSVSEKRSADSVGKRRKLTPEEEERAWGEPDVLFIEKREIKPRQPSDGLSESERQKRLKNWIGDSEKEEKDIYYQLEQKQLAENRAREEELRKTKPKRMSMQTYKSLVTEAEKEITGTDKTIDGDEIVENDDEKPDDIVEDSDALFDAIFPGILKKQDSVEKIKPSESLKPVITDTVTSEKTCGKSVKVIRCLNIASVDKTKTSGVRVELEVGEGTRKQPLALLDTGSDVSLISRTWM